MSRRHPRHRRRPRVLLTLVFLLAALAAVYRIVIHKPSVPPADKAPASVSPAAGQSAAAAAPPEPDRFVRRPDFFTILVSGMDDDNGGSDTNILVAFDAAGKSVHCVSVPRDTGVFYKDKARKANYPSNFGVRVLADTLEDTLGVPVDFTVLVDLKGFAALVNAIGGVNFYIPENMDYDDPVQDLHIHFQEGETWLNGEDALKVVRFRHNNDGSGYNGLQDIGRIGTQQKFLKAVVKKMLANPQKIGEYAKIFEQYVDTDLKAGELAWFGEQAALMGLDSITFSTLPGEWSGKRNLYLIDPEAALELVNGSLNPYTLDRERSDMNLVE